LFSERFQWFKNAAKGDDMPPCLADLFATLEPIYQFHIGFLRELEQRLAMWEGKSNAHLNGDYQRIGDLMVNSFLTSLGVSCDAVCMVYGFIFTNYFNTLSSMD